MLLLMRQTCPGMQQRQQQASAATIMNVQALAKAAQARQAIALAAAPASPLSSPTASTNGAGSPSTGALVVKQRTMSPGEYPSLRRLSSELLAEAQEAARNTRGFAPTPQVRRIFPGPHTHHRRLVSTQGRRPWQRARLQQFAGGGRGAAAAQADGADPRAGQAAGGEPADGASASALHSRPRARFSLTAQCRHDIRLTGSTHPSVTMIASFFRCRRSSTPSWRRRASSTSSRRAGSTSPPTTSRGRCRRARRGSSSSTATRRRRRRCSSTARRSPSTRRRARAPRTPLTPRSSRTSRH